MFLPLSPNKTFLDFIKQIMFLKNLLIYNQLKIIKIFMFSNNTRHRVCLTCFLQRNKYLFHLFNVHFRKCPVLKILWFDRYRGENHYLRYGNVFHLTDYMILPRILNNANRINLYFSLFRSVLISRAGYQRHRICYHLCLKVSNQKNA